MPEFRSDLMRVLHERGFVHQCTDDDGLDALIADGPITAYIGFDCTAPSLHAGSLMPIMLLRWLQKTGHRPIVLMGGGTTKVGDPSGRDEMRQLVDGDRPEHQFSAALQDTIEKFSIPRKHFHDLIDGFDEKILEQTQNTAFDAVGLTPAH